METSAPGWQNQLHMGPIFLHFQRVIPYIQMLEKPEDNGDFQDTLIILLIQHIPWDFFIDSTGKSLYTVSIVQMMVCDQLLRWFTRE